MSLIIASVLKSGGQYTPQHVRILQAMVKRNLPAEHRFTVLTDQVQEFREDREINAIPLQHRWETWWSKLELFDGVTFNRGFTILYMDLDVAVVGDLSD